MSKIRKALHWLQASLLGFSRGMGLSHHSSVEEFAAPADPSIHRVRIFSFKFGVIVIVLATLLGLWSDSISTFFSGPIDAPNLTKALQERLELRKNESNEK